MRVLTSRMQASSAKFNAPEYRSTRLPQNTNLRLFPMSIGGIDVPTLSGPGVNARPACRDTLNPDAVAAAKYRCLRVAFDDKTY